MAEQLSEHEVQYRSLRSIARQLDAHRSSVRRWLASAGIRPVAFGAGARPAIRYRAADVDQWLARRPQAG